ncbi:MAG: hypothetical protein LBL72_03120, partial [Candidatus Accumulibacter sp.]|nr:hypothetical protein [Accumulibacter sp.]
MTGDVHGNSTNPNGSDSNETPSNKTLLITGTGVVVTGDAYGAYTAGSGTVQGNQVEISGTATIVGDVVGGESQSGQAIGNTVILNAGTVGNGSTSVDVYGGIGDGGASNNTVEIHGGTVMANGTSNGAAIGGFVNNTGSGVVEHNTVKMTAGTVYELYGGMHENAGDANWNTAVLEGGNVGSVFGAMTDGAANNNTVTIRGASSSIGGDVFGGKGDTSADWNTVIIEASYSGTAGFVYGGDAYNGAANNKVEIHGGTVLYGVFGGSSDSGAATDNTVNLNGGRVDGDVSGGASYSGAVTGNFVNLNSGHVGGYVYGGSSDSGAVTGNTVNLNGGVGVMTFAASTELYGGYCYSSCSDAFTGNTLNVRAAGNTVASIQNFQFMNFYLPATLGAGSTVLTVSGNVNFQDASNTDKTEVQVGIAGNASPLKEGDRVTLIDASGGGGSLTGSPINPTTSGQGMQGVTLKYEFGLSTLLEANKLIATVTSAPVVTQQSKSLSEGYLSGTSFLSQGADFLLGKGMSAARTAVAEGNAGRPEVFAALGYGKIHNQTGSSVAVKGYNLVTGLAFGKRLETASVTGAFFF